MAGEFWLGVLQTMIGSAVGFFFGIAAFHWQQRSQLSKQEKEEWRSALDALNRLTMAAGANIEALANSKIHLIADMKPEVDAIKAISDEIYEAPSEERAKRVSELVTLSGSMLHFYMTLPETSIMHPPAFSEYSSLSKDMPALTLFVHRAVTFTQELNEYARTRNNLIAQQALESDMTAERTIYYASMLSGMGNAICETTDNALDFWLLCFEQVRAYMQAKAQGEHVVSYQIAPRAMQVMPQEELFPLMRQQLVTFD
ncbi:hypothetical protein [Thalassospira profundimaris]|uniref:hypothetical protein n=1 Tax=Thalassospira profundimaris TaxID=502049 RepID=UPI0002871F6B|nr:hypothetical protein [Thalassospira profundimaris]EKF08693.1 hypothetical protein TH2_07391 [Thalassospira profundimaris WP0211]